MSKKGSNPPPPKGAVKPPVPPLPPNLRYHRVGSRVTAIEADPNGLAPSDPGAKLDQGKQIAGEIILAFPRAISALIEIATFGAAKYSRQGFLAVPDAERRYLDALMRHLLKYGKGEALDPDSGLHHLHHALWNMAAIVEIHERNTSDGNAA